MFAAIKSFEWIGFSRCVAFLLAFMGVVLLIERLWGVSLFLFSDRISMFTAIGFTTSGFALFTLYSPALKLTSQLASALTILVGGISLFGYLWNISDLNSSSVSMPPVPHTDFAMMLLGVVLLWANLQRAKDIKRVRPIKAVEFKLLLGFVGALLMIVAGVGITYRASTHFAESVKQIAHTQEVRVMLIELYTNLSDIELVQRNYLLTGEFSQKAQYLRKLDKVQDQQQILAQLIGDNPAQMSNVTTLSEFIVRRLDSLVQTLAVYEHQGLMAAQKEIITNSGRDVMNHIHNLIDAMDNIELRLQQEHETTAEHTRQFNQVYMLLTLLLAATMMTGLFIAIRREMQIRDEVETKDDTHRHALMLYSGTVSREQVLRELLELLAKKHGYMVSASYAYEEWSGELVCAAGHSLPPNTPSSCRLGEGLVGEVAQSGQLVCLADPSLALLSIVAGIGSISPAALLAVPLIFRGQLQGVLVLASLSQLSKQDCNFVGHITSHLSVALNNLKQFSDLQYMVEQLRERSDEMSQKNQQLEEAYRIKNEFFVNMSHELRTPLNAIIGFSESLKDGLMGPVTESQREYIEDIYTSGEHLLMLINDILDLSKIESGKMMLDLEPIAINVLLQNSLNMVKGKALNHHLKLEVHVDTLNIVADMRKLKQIVYNLLSNAVKFTPDGGAITLTAYRVDDMLEIAVTDTGIGITQRDQEHLFESFSQIDSALSRQYQGTGLGLVMIKRLAELHGGSVGLESEAGKGTRFWVKIPLRIPG